MAVEEKSLTPEQINRLRFLRDAAENALATHEPRHWQEVEFYAAALLGPLPAALAEVRGTALVEIGALIASQDNRATDAPLFGVDVRRRIYGVEEGYAEGFVWQEDHQDGEGAEDVDEPLAEALERVYQRRRVVPDGFLRVGYVDVWEFVTGCFTEAGCKEYLRQNGHNHGETRIYAYSTFRNAEFRTVRQHLLSFAAPAKFTPGEAAE